MLKVAVLAEKFAPDNQVRAEKSLAPCPLAACSVAARRLGCARVGLAYAMRLHHLEQPHEPQPPKPPRPSSPVRPPPPRPSQWYVDVALSLLERAGDFCGEDIWHRMVQLVTNSAPMQAYAAERVRAGKAGWRWGRGVSRIGDHTGS